MPCPLAWGGRPCGSDDGAGRSLLQRPGDQAYWQLLRKHKRIGDYDILMVGYPGQFDVFLARILANRRHKPLVWDVFMSISLVLERGLDQARAHLSLIRNAEAKALKKPDMLIRIPNLCGLALLKPMASHPKVSLVPTG